MRGIEFSISEYIRRALNTATSFTPALQFSASRDVLACFRAAAAEMNTLARLPAPVSRSAALGAEKLALFICRGYDGRRRAPRR